MRAVDSLEARARELAKIAGTDPDSRIVKPGSARGMPAWCGFRELAKAQFSAEQATEAMHEIANQRPQEERFQNAPLTVFGQHDEATLTQMKNCLQVGNVTAGVICADGHIGYAQPIGGVIAYKKQISISGVGFDIGCFSGDTRIFTLDGQNPPIAEVVGKDVFILSSDDKGTPIPTKGTVKLTRRNAELVLVTLDNGRQIRCTPDQEFMLRDGSYKRADGLTAKQSLMPLYTTFDKDGYVLVRDSAKKVFLRLHRLVYAAGLTDRNPQVLSERVDVHHVDDDRTNNDPHNLEAMDHINHSIFHAATRNRGRSRGKNSVIERLILGSKNHKVVSVEPISEREDVYCLSVPKLANFALADGIFVHNCGNAAVRLDTPYETIKDRVGLILDDVWKTISFGVGRTNNERAEHALFDDADAWRESDMNMYRQKAVAQLGTVGSGNHYVDLMRDEAGYVWIGVHFGSRGFGHTSATRYLKMAGGKDGMHVAPAIVDEDSELGGRYIAAMHLAGTYARAGREWVLERVRKIIGGNITGSVHNHHNYAWKEKHFIDGVEQELWVVRKGATPAFPGQRGFIGGSMGDDAVIIEGVDSAEAKASLYSTVHGAGRLHGRKDAIRTFTRAEMDAWLQARGVMLRGGGVDESPMAYRRLPEVLKHHANSIKIIHTLRPFAVAMAGAGEFDPWKD